VDTFPSESVFLQTLSHERKGIPLSVSPIHSLPNNVQTLFPSHLSIAPGPENRLGVYEGWDSSALRPERAVRSIGLSRSRCVCAQTFLIGLMPPMEGYVWVPLRAENPWANLQ
jgi:hypothetical protein